MMIFDWNDILILGGSYTTEREEATDWPQRLALRLTNREFDPNYSPSGQGFGGCSWWSTRRRLLNDLSIHIPKVMVICHTTYSSIPSDDDLPSHVWLSPGICGLNFIRDPETQRPSFEMITREQSAYNSAVQAYYQHLYSPDFAGWAQLQWYKELDTMVKDIPYCIHLHTVIEDFQPQGKLHVFDQGVTITNSLRDKCDTRVDPRNHLTKTNNIILADLLYDLIQNWPGNGPFTLNW